MLYQPLESCSHWSRSTASIQLLQLLQPIPEPELDVINIQSPVEMTGKMIYIALTDFLLQKQLLEFYWLK